MYVTFLHLTCPVHGNQERVLGCPAEIGASLKGCVHRQDWPTSLQTIVLREFDSVKKGWFNVREKNVDLYRHGKLRRFLLLARLMMQDTLRNLAKMSVQSYVSTIERLAPVNVSVKSIYGAECTFRESFQNPVLTVEVRPSEGFYTFRFCSSSTSLCFHSPGCLQCWPPVSERSLPIGKIDDTATAAIF